MKRVPETSRRTNRREDTEGRESISEEIQRNRRCEGIEMRYHGPCLGNKQFGRKHTHGICGGQMRCGGSLPPEILKEYERTKSEAPCDAQHLDFTLKAIRTRR